MLLAEKRAVVGRGTTADRLGQIFLAWKRIAEFHDRGLGELFEQKVEILEVAAGRPASGRASSGIDQFADRAVRRGGSGSLVRRDRRFMLVRIVSRP